MFADMINWAKGLLGPLYVPLYHLFYIIFPFNTPDNLHWFFLITAIGIAAWMYHRGVDHDGSRSLVGFRRYLIPRSIYLHPSAIDDYKFYVVNQFFLLGFGSLVALFWAIFAIADRVKQLMTFSLGEPNLSAPGMAGVAFYSLVIFVCVDFGKWLAHFLEHKVPVLWEFHKVHHSAEVLTPVTNYRLHPIDFVVEQSIKAVIFGLIVGVFSYWFPKRQLVEYTVFNMGALAALSWLTNYLRHSHIPLSFGRFNYIFSSPVLHQIHHSSEVRHHDKNFSLVLSIWDHFAGTLYLPNGRETFKLGVHGPEPRPYRGLLALYFAPFGQVISTFGRGKTRQRETVADVAPQKECAETER